jgi:hypothetical protein
MRIVLSGSFADKASRGEAQRDWPQCPPTQYFACAQKRSIPSPRTLPRATALNSRDMADAGSAGHRAEWRRLYCRWQRLQPPPSRRERRGWRARRGRNRVSAREERSRLRLSCMRCTLKKREQGRLCETHVSEVRGIATSRCGRRKKYCRRTALRCQHWPLTG